MNDTITQTMKDAAYERWLAEGDERRRIEEIVLGARPLGRLGDIVKVGDDYLAEVIQGRNDASWTTVVNGKRSPRHYDNQEDAILHLIARRYDDNENTSHMAAHYAGRVLGVQEA